MKKKIFIYLIPILILFLIAFSITPKKSDLKKIKLAEVAHSVFYAPQYVAHALG